MRQWDDDQRPPSLAEQASCWVLIILCGLYLVGQIVRGCAQ